MKTAFSVALAAAGIATLAGCAQEPAPICNMAGIAAQRKLVALPAAAPGDPSPLLEMPLNSLSVIDHSIMEKVFARSVVARRTPAGTVEVVAQVINCTDYPLNVEARTQFFDKTQVASEPVSAWKRVHMPARSTNTYREMSLGTKDAAYYLVEMRETR